MAKKHFIFRLKVAIDIIRGKHESFTLISISDKQIVNVISDLPFSNAKVVYRMPPYIYHRLLKKLASEKTNVDMCLDKATLQAEFSEVN